MGAGTNNARLAGMLRQLGSYYYKEPTLLLLVRMAQGLVHLGKGLLTLNPKHADQQLLSSAPLACPARVGAAGHLCKSEKCSCSIASSQAAFALHTAEGVPASSLACKAACNVFVHAVCAASLSHTCGQHACRSRRTQALQFRGQAEHDAPVQTWHWRACWW